jgi:hypothetical protein
MSTNTHQHTSTGTRTGITLLNTAGITLFNTAGTHAPLTLLARTLLNTADAIRQLDTHTHLTVINASSCEFDRHTFKLSSRDLD